MKELLTLSKLFWYIGPIWKSVPESLDTIRPLDLRIWSDSRIQSGIGKVWTRDTLAAGFIGRVGPLAVNSNFYTVLDYPPGQKSILKGCLENGFLNRRILESGSLDTISGVGF